MRDRQVGWRLEPWQVEWWEALSAAASQAIPHIVDLLAWYEIHQRRLARRRMHQLYRHRQVARRRRGRR